MERFQSEQGCDDSLHPLIDSGTHHRRVGPGHEGRAAASINPIGCVRRCLSRRGFFFILPFILLIIFMLVYRWDLYLSVPKLVPFQEILSKPDNIVTFNQIIQENFEFDMKSSDVMVFLHMQKTGGTVFGKHLVEDLELERDCDCIKGWNGRKKTKLRCNCFRPGKGSRHWLFSRYSTGWKCGLHPDWTELTSCVDPYLQGLEGNEESRRYFYITFLREPSARFISEFKHVQRGATWSSATHMCGGISWTDRLPRCYQDDDWSDVDLKTFMDCKHNLAFNRQTRMLADLELVNCYNTSGMSSEARDRILLSSAKANLEKMAYFGITEEQRTSQYLFETTFNLRFANVLGQYTETHSSNAAERIQDTVLDRILELNSLDHELYVFALQLMQQRFTAMQELDPDFREHLSRLETAAREFNNDHPEEQY
jgi:heparan sulfate 6-O-sulfotransferase HS6ST1